VNTALALTPRGGQELTRPSQEAAQCPCVWQIEHWFLLRLWWEAAVPTRIFSLMFLAKNYHARGKLPILISRLGSEHSHCLISILQSSRANGRRQMSTWGWKTAYIYDLWNHDSHRPCCQGLCVKTFKSLLTVLILVL